MGNKRKHNFEEKELSSTKAKFRVYKMIIFYMYVTIKCPNYSLISNLNHHGEVV